MSMVQCTNSSTDPRIHVATLRRQTDPEDGSTRSFETSENIYTVPQSYIPEDFNFQEGFRENLSQAKPCPPKLHFSARGYKVCEEFTAPVTQLP